MFLFRFICALFFLANCSAAHAAVPEKSFKVMMLLYRGMTDAEKGFTEYFRRRNINTEFIFRDAQGDNDKIAGFVEEAKRIRPDLIYTFGTTMTAAVVGLPGKIDAARNITDIPVVFNIVADPVGAGLLGNLAASGRNLTGASHMVPVAAQLSALQAMRNTEVLGVVYNPQEQNSALAVQELKRVAPKHKLNVLLAPVHAGSGGRPTVEGLKRAVAALLEKKPQFIYLPSDSFLIKNARLVVQAARAQGVPVFAATETPIRHDGALLGLVSNYYNVGELAAFKAEQILVKKVSPSTIPVELLNRYTYLVNMDAARKMSVYPPVAVFKFAEIVAPLDGFDPRE